MSATVWGKFFWSDWRSDPGLRACSYAARGLWMDMLCIAAEAEPKGYVSINGRACDAKAIARVTGGQIEEVESLLTELEEHGVFSKTAEGLIYSRRMVNDGEKAKTGAHYGKQGGYAPELPLPPTGGVGGRGGGAPLTQSPDTRVQIPDSKSGRARAGARHRLPEDWKPSSDDLAYAAEKGFNPSRINDMAESFRDHHRNKGTLGLDWAAAWRTWVRNEIKFAPKHGGGSGRGGAATMADIAMGRDR